MAQRALEQRVENLEHRVATVEQILPTLATKADLAELKSGMKADLQAAFAPLATKAELQAAIAPLATKVEMKAEAEQTRRYFDVVAEGLRADIRLIAEGQTAIQKSMEATHADIVRVLEQHDRRLMRREASQKRR